jgi:hypothetical protein
MAQQIITFRSDSGDTLLSNVPKTSSAITRGDKRGGLYNDR